MKKERQLTVTDQAKSLYDDMLQTMPEASKMTIADRHLLLVYATHLDLFNRAVNEIAVNGYAQTFENGTQQISPNYTVLKQSTAFITALGKELMLTTAAKVKAKISAPIEDTDPLNEL